MEQRIRGGLRGKIFFARLLVIAVGFVTLLVVTMSVAATVAHLQSAGVRFRNAIVIGNGGQQILAEDPSGNLIELFQPTG